MRFFGEYDGLIWEFNSFGDWVQFHICRFIGKLLGTIILIILGLIVVGLLS
jgi:hypothetical protein